MRAIKQFLADERGLETVEYAVISGILVASLVLVVAAIAGWVTDQFANMQGELPDA